MPSKKKSKKPRFIDLEKEKQKHGSSVAMQLARQKRQLLRVIAPFVTMPRRIKPKAEDEQFSFYLKKKPHVLIKDLSRFMSDSVDLPSLFHETADVLKHVTRASWVTLYLVDHATDELYLSTLNVVPDRYRVRWKIKECTLVATFVAKYKEYVLTEDVLMDGRFSEGIGYQGDAPAQAVMCVPVVTPEGECIGVIEFVRTVHYPPFQIDHLKLCVMVTAWMGVAIYQNQERLALQRQQELNDYLLDLVKCYFEDHVLMEKLMNEVVKFAQTSLGAERGSFFILDQENDEMVAYLFEETDPEYTKPRKVRFSKERGIAGLVARTGTTLNIRDAYKDARFNKEIDQKTGFITRSILCMPIRAASGILGVVQVVNKRNGPCFTSADETLFKTFSLYCAMALHYTNVHTEINRQKRLNTINYKLVQLQQVPCVHSLKFFMDNIHVKIPENFSNFSWYINNNEELKITPQYTLYCFFQLIDIKEMNVKVMINFILTVRKLYRDIPYHNFEHAFNVFHCMYCILKRNPEKFTKIEVKALLVACLCHDLDHVGFTNNFLQLIKHDLACLYESSVLENHHWNITKKLLGEHEIFYGFTEESRKMFLYEVQKAIIATDLALYFESRANLLKLMANKELDWRDDSHRSLIKAIMMNSCDLSGSCKPFLAAKRIADSVYREFYWQGDKEKELGLCPLSVMDREKPGMIPDDQIRFLNVVCIPCVDILRTVLPNTKDLYNGAMQLRTFWQEIIDTKGKKIWRQDDSIVKS